MEVGCFSLEVSNEIRDKAAKLLSAYREDERGKVDEEAVTIEACVGIMGDLLVLSDNISLKIKERVEG